MSPARPVRRMRYDTAQHVAVRQRAEAQMSAREREDEHSRGQDTMNDTTAAEDLALDADPGALGLDAGEWVAAAQNMSQEAIERQLEAAQDPGADNLGDTGDSPAQPDWGDAFTAATEAPGHADDRPGRYRERLTTAESEVDRLRGMVEQLQRAEVDRLAAAQLADPADLWRGDNAPALADLVGDDGRVDPGKLAGAVDRILTEHPHWRAPMARYRGEMRSGATQWKIEPRSSFADAFGPKTE